MLVRLTDKGRAHFGFSADRTETTVSAARAFAMMNAGLAIADKGFMALFDGPAAPVPAPAASAGVASPASDLPDPDKAATEAAAGPSDPAPDTEPELEPDPAPDPSTTEKAVSRKAQKRRTAIKKGH